MIFVVKLSKWVSTCLEVWKKSVLAKRFSQHLNNFKQRKYLFQIDLRVGLPLYFSASNFLEVKSYFGFIYQMKFWNLTCLSGIAIV